MNGNQCYLQDKHLYDLCPVFVEFYLLQWKLRNDNLCATDGKMTNSEKSYVAGIGCMMLFCWNRLIKFMQFWMVSIRNMITSL